MLERIRQNLTLEAQEASSPENLTPAAVLFPLLLKENNLHVLFTKRTQTVKAHKGQVSFPGGVRDPHDENLLATALREAQEEIDLKPKDVEILGVLDPITTVTTGFLVYKTFISSQDKPSCVFTPSCSEYALESIRTKGLVLGWLNAFDRLSRCHGLVHHKHYEFDIEKMRYSDPLE
jgi:putative component of membrane protein insertase Oxa1/YidC/SpoIIIJ protein YidD